MNFPFLSLSHYLFSLPVYLSLVLAEEAKSNKFYEINKPKPHPQAQGKIIGGTQTEKGRYDYFVNIMNEKGEIRCGGSLISSTHILTCAQCIYTLEVPTSILSVTIGRWNYTSPDDETYETIDVDYALIHPEYDVLFSSNDYGIIKLKEESSYTPVNLDLDGNFALGEDVNVTILGAGAISTDGDTPAEVLMEAELSMVSRSTCKELYSDMIERFCESVFPENIACASSKDGVELSFFYDGLDAVIQDYGGPVVIKGAGEGANVTSSDVQVGVITWKGGENRPDVFGKVSNASDFVNCVIEEEGSSGDNCGVIAKPIKFFDHVFYFARVFSFVVYNLLL